MIVGLQCCVREPACLHPCSTKLFNQITSSPTASHEIILDGYLTKRQSIHKVSALLGCMFRFNQQSALALVCISSDIILCFHADGWSNDFQYFHIEIDSIDFASYRGEGGDGGFQKHSAGNLLLKEETFK